MTPWRCPHGLTSLETCAACGRVVSGMTLDDLRTLGRFLHAMTANGSVPPGEAFLIPARRPQETDAELAARCVRVVNIGEEENER